MPRHWEVFPRRRWPRGFGSRETYRPRPPIDSDQLELLELVLNAEPHEPTVREQLRAILERSELPQREFASWVLGASDVTLSRYLAGARIPECRRNFIRRLERVLVRGDLVIITLRVGAVRKVPRWLLERRKRGGR